jgi:hypothetical protein
MNREKLSNLASVDANINELQTSHPRLFRGVKNLGDATKILINSTFPPKPMFSFRESFIIPGNPAVANDILPYRYHVVLPKDPDGNWSINAILLTGYCITAKVQGTTNDLSIDIKTSQEKGTTSFKSLFRSGANLILPPNTTSTHNMMFAINRLELDDLLRVDVLATDPTVSGISVDLIGTYELTEL